MKSTLSFLALMTTLTLVSSLVCPHNYCDNVQCTAIAAEDCVGKVVPHGSFCGCCDHCVSILEPGQNCFGVLLRGMPPTVACPDGYICDSKTITCQPQVSQ